MKKLLLTTILLGVLLTGCEKTEEVKAEVIEETTIEEVLIEEEFIEETIICEYTEEEVYEMRDYTISQIEEGWEEAGFSEECKNESIELLMDVKYDPTFEYGYDLETLERDYVSILVKYGILPSVCDGMSFDEVNEVDDVYFENL